MKLYYDANEVLKILDDKLYLIDARNAIMALPKQTAYSRSQVIDIFTEGYKEAYEHGSKSKWIPVTERLPEEEGWYLVTIQNDKTRKRRTENDLFAIGIAEAHKHTPYKFCKDGHRQTVIAWMPLPEPYKEAE